MILCQEINAMLAAAKILAMVFSHSEMALVAVSCGYSTCFAVSAYDGLCNLTKSMDRVGIPIGFQPMGVYDGGPLKLALGEK